MAAGLSNSQIGARLFVAPKTVANHVTAILSKLHLGTRIEAILSAREAGLGRPDPTGD
jgi:DNA-binding NarL/FixJ family response regulator